MVSLLRARSISPGRNDGRHGHGHGHGHRCSKDHLLGVLWTWTFVVDVDVTSPYPPFGDSVYCHSPISSWPLERQVGMITRLSGGGTRAAAVLPPPHSFSHSAHDHYASLSPLDPWSHALPQCRDAAAHYDQGRGGLGALDHAARAGAHVVAEGSGPHRHGLAPVLLLHG